MEYLTQQHRVAVVVCGGWDDYAVFSTLLDTLLAERRRSSVELGTVTHGNHELVHLYSKEYNMPFSRFCEFSSELLNFAHELVVFTKIDDSITKHMAETATQRGIPTKIILVEPSEFSF